MNHSCPSTGYTPALHWAPVLSTQESNQGHANRPAGTEALGFSAGSATNQLRDLGQVTHIKITIAMKYF